MLVIRITLIAALWVIGGCSAASSSGPTPDSSEPSAGSPAANLPASVVDPVVAEVARLAGVSADQVTVVSAQDVTYPDGSLGCPQPGMVYTQALVDGYKVVAEAGGKTYDFRGTGTTFRLCSATG